LSIHVSFNGSPLSYLSSSIGSSRFLDNLVNPCLKLRDQAPLSLEVFDTEKTLRTEEACQLVTVKEQHGNRDHHGKSSVKGQIVTQLANWVGAPSVFKGPLSR